MTDFDNADRPIAVEIRDGAVWVTLADGRVIGNPLDWHPWLADATPAQQANYELCPFSVDWPDLDEGLDIEGMLRGIRPRVREPQQESDQA
ncbi:MAG: DUF2442 domain-containing protein [Anaerolineae bacterium]|nr:DUF2442 domain-containing protein [Anaerolineae bacterium]